MPNASALFKAWESESVAHAAAMTEHELSRQATTKAWNELQKRVRVKHSLELELLTLIRREPARAILWEGEMWIEEGGALACRTAPQQATAIPYNGALDERGEEDNDFNPDGVISLSSLRIDSLIDDDTLAAQAWAKNKLPCRDGQAVI